MLSYESILALLVLAGIFVLAFVALFCVDDDDDSL